METLKEALLRLAPSPDLLHDCLGFGRFAEVAYSPSGYFLGRAWGARGFDHYLGHPSPETLSRTRALFAKLSQPHKEELIRSLCAREIPPESLGLPPDNHKPPGQTLHIGDPRHD